MQNRFLRKGSLFFCVVFLITGCNKNSPVTTASEQIVNEVTIDLSDRKQVIRNFGASDAWTCQFVGLWPDAKRNQVADWLFSTEEDANGQPKGIGLSLWRFNIGAGSAAQDNISDDWRRAEGFLKNDLTYDWSKQAGQRWFMHAAKARGVEKFVGFTNSPPVQLTKNGKAYSSNGEEANIPKANYAAFAKFLGDVTAHFKTQEVGFTYLSPFNEPQWDWTENNQEGSPYRNDEISAITKKVDSVFTKMNLDTKIQIAEAGVLIYLYEKADKPTRGEQITQFFNSGSSLYIGDLPHVDHVISGHSYFTSAPVDAMKTVREKVSATLKNASVPLEFWQSEYCVLGDREEIKAEGKDMSIDPALYIARLIHHDLVLGNAAAWHWWLAVSAYDYKDGLIYVDKNKSDGSVTDSKMLWALGNYSRFIRPGATRVGVRSDNMDVNNVKSVMVSAYMDETTGQVIAVIINTGNANSSLNLKVDGADVKEWKSYVTGPGADEKLKPASVTADSAISIPRRSIVTLVGSTK
jgi:O-glycosyl hydrolase